MSTLLLQVFAASFADTIMSVDGTKEWEGPAVHTTSPLLTALGWRPQYDLATWAASPHVINTFRRSGK